MIHAPTSIVNTIVTIFMQKTRWLCRQHLSTGIVVIHIAPKPRRLSLWTLAPYLTHPHVVHALVEVHELGKDSRACSITMHHWATVNTAAEMLTSSSEGTATSSRSPCGTTNSNKPCTCRRPYVHMSACNRGIGASSVSCQGPLVIDG